MNRHTIEMLGRLQQAGISTDDALALRRIAMTLHRWFELECGGSNDYRSWCIIRGHKKNGQFEYSDDGAPYMEVHQYGRGNPSFQADSVHYTKLADRETGAKKRLARIMAKYPGLAAYVQADPRGAPLYILKAEDMKADKHETEYTRGIAIYK